MWWNDHFGCTREALGSGEERTEPIPNSVLQVLHVHRKDPGLLRSLRCLLGTCGICTHQLIWIWWKVQQAGINPLCQAGVSHDVLTNPLVPYMSKRGTSCRACYSRPFHAFSKALDPPLFRRILTKYLFCNQCLIDLWSQNPQHHRNLATAVLQKPQGLLYVQEGMRRPLFYRLLSDLLQIHKNSLKILVLPGRSMQILRCQQTWPELIAQIYSW